MNFDLEFNIGRLIQGEFEVQMTWEFFLKSDRLSLKVLKTKQLNERGIKANGWLDQCNG
jgi:hypothetical protein